MIETISDRQLEIIEAAGKILTASGVSGLTIKNLAREMKFSESAIYYCYFQRAITRRKIYNVISKSIFIL